MAETRLYLPDTESESQKSQGSRALSGATIQFQAPLPFRFKSRASPCTIWWHCSESCFWTELCPDLLPNSHVQAKPQCDYTWNKEVTEVT